jgi:hypothetical protein
MSKKIKRTLDCTFFIMTILFVAAVSNACTSNTPAALASSSEDPTTIVLRPRTFAVNTHGQPVLKLTGDVCQIRVQSGTGASMLIQTVVHHYQSNPMPTITYNQSRDRKAVTINEKLPPETASTISNDSVSITITMPSHMDLFLSTRVGAISVANVSGQFALSTATGSINVVHAQLNKLSSLTTNVGSIFFAGTLLPQGIYRIETRVGSISLALQRPSSLNVDAQTTIGSIHSDFSSLAIDGNVAQGTLGTPPYAHLSLATRVGSIAVLSQ